MSALLLKRVNLRANLEPFLAEPLEGASPLAPLKN
jgi:hypothetical protein